MQGNQYLINFAYKICLEEKTTNFYKLCKFKPNTFIINHFIIEYKLHGMVTAVEFRDVPRLHCFSILLYTFMHFWLGTQNLINLNNFLHEY